MDQTDKRALSTLCQTDQVTQYKPRLRKQIQGHFGKIYVLDWSSDSKDIVSASQDGKLLIWNVATTNKRLSIPLRSSWVMTTSFSPDNSLVASGGLDNLVSIFKLDDNGTDWSSKQLYRELQQHEGYLGDC